MKQYLNTKNFNYFIKENHYKELSLVKEITGYSKESMFLFKTHRQVISQKFLDLWVEFTEEPESNWVTNKRIKQ